MVTPLEINWTDSIVHFFDKFMIVDLKKKIKKNISIGGFGLSMLIGTRPG